MKESTIELPNLQVLNGMYGNLLVLPSSKNKEFTLLEENCSCFTEYSEHATNSPEGNNII